MADPRHRERVEPWPGGDQPLLVRSEPGLAVATAPGVTGRVADLSALAAHLVTDFHEMGTSGTYFFQPGVPSRQGTIRPASEPGAHPSRSAAIHAKALDALGQAVLHRGGLRRLLLRQGFQLSGHLRAASASCSSRPAPEVSVRRRCRGILEFPFTIHNQVITSLSSLEAALEKREELLVYQAWFFSQARREAAGDPVKGYLCDGSPDPARRHALLEVLLGHGIEVHELEKDGHRSRAGPAGASGRAHRPGSVSPGQGPLHSRDPVRRHDLLRHLELDTPPGVRPRVSRELHRQDREIATPGAPLFPGPSLPEGHFQTATTPTPMPSSGGTILRPAPFPGY